MTNIFNFLPFLNTWNPFKLWFLSPYMGNTTLNWSVTSNIKYMLFHLIGTSKISLFEGNCNYFTISLNHFNLLSDATKIFIPTLTQSTIFLISPSPYYTIKCAQQHIWNNFPLNKQYFLQSKIILQDPIGNMIGTCISYNNWTNFIFSSPISKTLM